MIGSLILGDEGRCLVQHRGDTQCQEGANAIDAPREIDSGWSRITNRVDVLGEGVVGPALALALDHRERHPECPGRTEGWGATNDEASNRIDEPVNAAAREREGLAREEGLVDEVDLHRHGVPLDGPDLSHRPTLDPRQPVWKHRAVLSIITANVNGIRAAERRGGLDWLGVANADVICLQEVRATHEQLHEVLRESPLADYFVAHVPAPDLGRAGVAILSRSKPVAIRESIKQADLGGLGRWVEADIQTPLGLVTVASVYVHSGEAGTQKQVDKMAFLVAMEKRLKSLKNAAAKAGSHVVVCGDFNVARAEIDIKNWKGNRDKAGFLPEEREYLNRWSETDWVDLGRVLGGEGPGPYTWWSWRGKAFDTDAGWRIDYHVATPDLAAAARDAVIDRAPSYAERWSDHAPVVISYRL